MGRKKKHHGDDGKGALSSDPHDRAFKQFFERKENAIPALKSILPVAWVERMDWDSLHLEPTEYQSQTQRKLHADVLFRTTMAVGERRQDLFLWVLLEHKSAPDPQLPLQLLRYQLAIWDRYVKDHPEIGKPGSQLPPILPMVVYHGKQGWQYARRFSDLYALGDGGWEGCGELLLDFGFVLDDLSQVSNEALERRSKHPSLYTFLWALKHARDSADALAALLPEMLVRGLQEMLRLGAEDDARTVLCYMMETYALSEDELQLHMHAIEDPLVQEAYMGAAEELIQRGERMGLKRGERMGIERGRHEERQDILIALLENSFGPLSASHRAQIERAEDRQIRTWLLRVRDAATIDAVLQA